MARPLLVLAAHILRLAPSATARAGLGVFRGIPGSAGLALRYICVRALAAECGDNVAVYPNCFLFNVENLHLGSNIKIGEMSFIGAAGGVFIDDDVSLAHATSILTEEHDLAHEGPIRDSRVLLSPVRIATGAWIGAGVRITAGVTIGPCAAIGAGSVVTRDVPSGVVSVGVPARVLRKRWQGTP